MFYTVVQSIQQMHFYDGAPHTSLLQFEVNTSIIFYENTTKSVVNSLGHDYVSSRKQRRIFNKLNNDGFHR